MADMTQSSTASTNSKQTQSRSWVTIIDNLLNSCEKVVRSMTNFLSTYEVHGKNIVTVAIVLGIGALSYFPLCYIFKTKAFKRYYFLNYMINKNVSVPKCYPVYVEHKKTIDNLKRKIVQGPGVLILCGLQDSGKSSCARNACNELLNDNKIHGIVDMLQGAYGEENNDSGSSWFNSNVKFEGLLDKNEPLSNIFGENTDPERKITNTNKMTEKSCNAKILHWCREKIFKKKKYVILFDQFEKNYEHSETEKFLTFIVKMAENAIYHDTYCVLICLSDPLIAAKIYKKNGGAKIGFIQDYLDLKWTKTEIDTFYQAVRDDNTSGFTESLKEIALQAGTAGFCKDLHRKIFGTSLAQEQRADDMKLGWNSNSNLLKEYLKK